MLKLKLNTSLVFLLGSLLLLGSCRKAQEQNSEPEGFVLQIPPGFPDMVFPEDNQYSYARWQLGKKLFYDPVLSRDSSLSCASCHKLELAFADDRAFSPGIQNRPGTRNATSLTNIGYHPYFLREGSVPTLEMQALVPVQEHNEFDHSMPEIAAKLQANARYRQMSEEAYEREPDPWVITRALGVFQRSLISGNSPYDRYQYQGESQALNKAEIRGMALFFSSRTQCASCHSGFNFSNYAFENNGLDSVYQDPLRMRLTNDPADEGRAKVPSLRNLAFSAPYMHDGRFQNLAEVIQHYQKGGAGHPNQSELIRPFSLSDQEQSDLIAFLLALSDPIFTQNQSFSEAGR
ncbi:cytochrome-c peroxidase [Croceimicrobium sp.]|uniref:cytochrome-c peroxidase n=1 Tax=Croceimicrobium sp. TaxID=2828340 RepID=UPI003BA9F46C